MLDDQNSPPSHWTSSFQAVVLMKYFGSAQMLCLLPYLLFLAQESYPIVVFIQLTYIQYIYSLAVELAKLDSLVLICLFYADPSAQSSLLRTTNSRENSEVKIIFN